MSPLSALYQFCNLPILDQLAAEVINNCLVQWQYPFEKKRRQGIPAALHVAMLSTTLWIVCVMAAHCSYST